MSPPLKEGDPAISRQNGTNPFPIFPENSLESILISIPDRIERRSTIISILKNYYTRITFPNMSPDQLSEKMVESNKFKIIQVALREALKENKILKRKPNIRRDFLIIHDRYVDNLFSVYAKELFYTKHTQLISDIDISILEQLKDRIKNAIRTKRFEEIDLEYDSKENLENFVYLVYSSRVKDHISETARLIRHYLEYKALENGTKTKLTEDLIWASNRSSPDIKVKVKKGLSDIPINLE